MVYESDFYTTRRPYSRPTPTISSYSVTTDRETTFAKAQPLRHNLPLVAHKRLTAPQAPPPRSKVRNAVLMAEIDRINHRYQLMRKLNYRVDPSETAEPPARIPSEYKEAVPEQSAYWRLRTRVRKGELPLTALAVHPYPQFSAARLMRFSVLPLSYKMRNLESAVPERFDYDFVDYQPVPLERFRYEYADNFDDETRSIRAQTAALLKRVHSPIPRSRGPLHAVLPTPRWRE